MIEVKNLEKSFGDLHILKGITTTIEANVQQPGEIVLPARMFGDIVR